MKKSSKSKYAVENQKWFSYCTKKNCQQKTVKCKVCGYPGHKTEWLNTTVKTYNKDNELCFGVNVLVAHAHFVADKDAGRHVEHKVAESIIEEKYCEKIHVLKRRKLPQHVKDMLDGLGD